MSNPEQGGDKTNNAKISVGPSRPDPRFTSDTTNDLAPYNDDHGEIEQIRADIAGELGGDGFGVSEHFAEIIPTDEELREERKQEREREREQDRQIEERDAEYKARIPEMTPDRERQIEQDIEDRRALQARHAQEQDDLYHHRGEYSGVGHHFDEKKKLEERQKQELRDLRAQQRQRRGETGE